MQEKSNAQICRDFEIVSSTLYTILKDKDKILNAHASGNFTGERKKIRLPNFFQVDEALLLFFLLFFKQATAQGTPIGGPQLIEKGKEIAEGLGLASFSMSQGWLDRWKARHGIAMKVKCGESLSVDKEATEDWKVLTLKPLLEQYNPCDIYNADETGLFYKCLPSRTLAFKGQTYSGGKLSKDRITLLVAANMDGSDKLPLLTIGKFEKRRCMKNIKSLPTSYKWNSKSWMTGKIFEEWVRKLDRSFFLKGRSVLLFIDNCAAHPQIKDLRAVKLVFLPPNTTSVLQPCDQGIIQNLKTIYRKRILRRLLADIGNGEGTSHFNMTILDAMMTIADAWDEVKQETIVNCFRHAGFQLSSGKATALEEASLTQCDPELNQLFSQLNSDKSASLDDYLQVDNQILPTEHLTIEDIIQRVRGDQREDEEEDDKDDSEAIPQVSSKTAEEAIKTLRHYLMQQEDSNSLLKDLNKFQNFVESTSLRQRKQTTITSFFKPN